MGIECQELSPALQRTCRDESKICPTWLAKTEPDKQHCHQKHHRRSCDVIRHGALRKRVGISQISEKPVNAGLNASKGPSSQTNSGHVESEFPFSSDQQGKESRRSQQKHKSHHGRVPHASLVLAGILFDQEENKSCGRESKYRQDTPMRCRARAHEAGGSSYLHSHLKYLFNASRSVGSREFCHTAAPPSPVFWIAPPCCGPSGPFLSTSCFASDTPSTSPGARRCMSS